MKKIPFRRLVQAWKIKRLPILVFLFCILQTGKMFAQDIPPNQPGVPQSHPERFWDRVFTGGNFGLQFGTITAIELAPIVGYRLTENLSAGIGIKYMYYDYKDAYVHYTSNIYGGSVFTRYLVTENFFAHVEYEVLNLDVPNLYGPGYYRKNITSVLVGGGYRQILGERSSINFLLLYNLNETRDSPYQNPIVRVGFGIGI